MWKTKKVNTKTKRKKCSKRMGVLNASGMKSKMTAMLTIEFGNLEATSGLDKCGLSGTAEA